MSKAVYVIVSDLHLNGANLRGRYDYNKEIDFVISEIVKIGLSYKDKGYDDINIILLGDVIDRSYKNLVKGIYANNIFVALKSLYNNIFSVVGNHEFSYYTDNPFWTLITQIKSEKIQKIKNKSWTPLGYLDLIEVVDKLEVGDVVFHFNHSGTEIGLPVDNKINIGLFHQDIICKDIINSMKSDYAMEVFEANPRYFDKSNILYGYDYCFFGHMHKVYGHWTYICDHTKYKSELYYLASLGRTNHTEVSNDFLERNIPAIIIENDKFVRVEDNKFNLMRREDCVKEEVVKENKQLLQKRNEIKRVLQTTPDVGEPIENIKSFLTQNPTLYLLFEDYLEGKNNRYEHSLMNRVEGIINGK